MLRLRFTEQTNFFPLKNFKPVDKLHSHEIQRASESRPRILKSGLNATVLIRILPRRLPVLSRLLLLGGAEQVTCNY